MENQGFIKIDRTGKTLVFGESLKRSLCHQAGYYTLDEYQHDRISFARVPSIPKFGELREPIIFQGDIGGIGSSIDVVNFIISARLTGQLNLVQGEVRKSIFFKGGELTAARSNHLDDRLSEVLFRFGALERDAIDKAEEVCAQTNQPLGNYLIRNNVLGQGQLYLFFKKQVEEIFYSTLLWIQGEFYFTVSHFDETPTPLKLNAQQLLLEGVRRADEMKRFKEKIPNLSTTLELVNDQGDLNDEQKAILAYLQTPRTMKQLINYFRVGEFNVYQRVFQLLNGGWLKVDETKLFDDQKLSVDELIMLFNRTFSMIQQFARQSGVEDALQTGLDVFLAFYHQNNIFDGINFDSKGRLNQVRLLENLDKLGQKENIYFVGQALCELLYIQIFSSRTWLSHDEHHQLQDVYEEISSLVSA